MGLSETGPAFTQAPLRHFTSLSGSLVPCCRHETLLAFPQGIFIGFSLPQFPGSRAGPGLYSALQAIPVAKSGSGIFGALPRAALCSVFYVRPLYAGLLDASLSGDSGKGRRGGLGQGLWYSGARLQRSLSLPFAGPAALSRVP